MSNQVSEAVVLMIGGTLIILLLVVFIFVFFIIHAKRRQAFLIEKEALEKAYRTEVQTAESEIREYTMKNISREIHDNIAQMLTLVKLNLNNLHVKDESEGNLNLSKEYLSKVIVDVRALSKSLNNENILQEGILNSIEFELDRLNKSKLINVIFEKNVSDLEIEKEKSLMIFRIFQEIVQNTLKYAKAKDLTVKTSIVENTFELELADNGRGFELQDAGTSKNQFGKSQGIENIRYRASLIGAKAFWESTLNKGTSFKLTLPL
jgi:signal transduction histidine kinase